MDREIDWASDHYLAEEMQVAIARVDVQLEAIERRVSREFPQFTSLPARVAFNQIVIWLKEFEADKRARDRERDNGG